jgi:hypothetical protein
VEGGNEKVAPGGASRVGPTPSLPDRGIQRREDIVADGEWSTEDVTLGAYLQMSQVRGDGCG